MPRNATTAIIEIYRDHRPLRGQGIAPNLQTNFTAKVKTELLYPLRSVTELTRLEEKIRNMFPKISNSEKFTATSIKC